MIEIEKRIALIQKQIYLQVRMVGEEWNWEDIGKYHPKRQTRSSDCRFRRNWNRSSPDLKRKMIRETLTLVYQKASDVQHEL